MGFFSKNTAPAPVAAPRAKGASKPAPVAITGLGIACHAGDQPYALISSVLGQMSGVQISDEHKMLSNDGSYVLPRMAPVKELFDNSDRDRMYTLSAYALGKVISKLPANLNLESLLVVIMVDAELITRFNKIDTQHLQSYLIDSHSGLSSAAFRILSNNTVSCTSVLQASITEMNDGKWQAIIFGGADSLISIYTCQELNEENRLNAVGKTEGIVPGEAASFVLLQSADASSKNSSQVLGYLRGMGGAAEPNARVSDLEATDGLTTAIGKALAQACVTAADIHGVVHGLGAETVQSLEWYQTTQNIWPRKVSEQQRIAVQNGEIEQADIPDDPIPTILLPHMTIGEVGAAALPMQLATALAWMEYDAWHARLGFPVRKHLLVCDTPNTTERGALVISTTLAAAA